MSTLPTIALRGEMPRIGRLSNRREAIGVAWEPVATRHDLSLRYVTVVLPLFESKGTQKQSS
jgi:hypothetical protein